jgi:hypothetical protein
MKPTDGTRKGPLAGIAVTLAVLLAASSCTKDVLVPSGTLKGSSPPSDVRITLFDQTQIQMHRPRLGDDDFVRGRITNCRGVSCTLARSKSGVPLSDVTTMEVSEISSGGVALALLGVAVAVGTVIVLSSSSSSPSSSSSSSSNSNGKNGGGGIMTSCPHVYAWDGHSWTLDSGTYGGSLFRAAERTDYDMLDHLAPDSGEYRLRLVNELKETEHTDALVLRVVDHPLGTKVVPTLAGKLLTFRDAQAPLEAKDLRGADVLARVSRRDGLEWMSDLSNRNPVRPDDTRDGVVLRFTKPPGAKKAKLWIAARNTEWSAQMLAYVLSQIGPDWWAKTNADADRRTQLRELLVREGALQVKVREDGVWIPRGIAWIAGREVSKDQAIEVPIGDVAGDRLELRLDAPVGFWTIDSVSISYDDDEPVTTRDLTMRVATSNDGKIVTDLLTAIDDRHYSTVEGDAAEIVFDAPPPAASLARSYVLVTTGYYVPNVVPDASARPEDLATWMTEPGALARRSLTKLNVAAARALLQ